MTLLLYKLLNKSLTFSAKTRDKIFSQAFLHPKGINSIISSEPALLRAQHRWISTSQAAVCRIMCQIICEAASYPNFAKICKPGSMDILLRMK